MISVTTREILDFPRCAVFQEGVRAANWPSVTGLSVVPSAETVDELTVIRAELAIPAIRIGLDCDVVEFVENRRVRIEGSSRAARAMLDFSLSDNEKRTVVDYTFEVTGKNLVTRLAEPAVKAFAAKAVPAFAAGYRANVENSLRTQNTY